MENFQLLIYVLTQLANRIKDFFISKTQFDLANQVDNLRIKGLCECGDPDCGSFYLTEYVVTKINSKVSNLKELAQSKFMKGKSVLLKSSQVIWVTKYAQH